MGECGKGVPGTGKSKCKGPDVGVVLVCLRNSKDKASVAEAGWVQEQGREHRALGLCRLTVAWTGEG